jgi:hypothetical protein
MGVDAGCAIYAVFKIIDEEYVIWANRIPLKDTSLNI